MDPIPNGGQGAVTRPVVQTDVGIVSLDVGNQSLREEVGVPTTLAVVWVVGQYYAQYPTPGIVLVPVQRGADLSVHEPSAPGVAAD